MKRINIVFLLLMVLCSGKLYSQVKEGKVDFIVTYPHSELSSDNLALLPDHTVVWFKDDQSRFDMKMGMGMNMSTIIDSKNMVILMDIVGMKTAIKKELTDFNKSDKSSTNKPKVTITADTKEIAGYHCKKAILKSADGDFEIWFTTEITGNNKWNDSFNGVNGFPMEFNMKTGQMEMHLIAEKVNVEKIDDAIFVVPNDYQFLTEEETKAMFDGLK